MYYITLKKILVLVFMGFMAGVALIYTVQASTVREIAERVIFLEAEVESLEGEKFLLDGIIERNPNLAEGYDILDSSRFGTVFYPASGTGVQLVISNGEVIGTIYSHPASLGWFPNADQPKDKPLDGTFGKYYTQTVLFKH